MKYIIFGDCFFLYNIVLLKHSLVVYNHRLFA